MLLMPRNSQPAPEPLLWQLITAWGRRRAGMYLWCLNRLLNFLNFYNIYFINPPILLLSFGFMLDQWILLFLTLRYEVKILIEEFSLLKFKTLKLAWPVFQNQVLVLDNRWITTVPQCLLLQESLILRAFKRRFLTEYREKTSGKQLIFGVASKHLSILQNL